MFCKKCGCSVKDGEKACNVCGTVVNEEQQKPQPTNKNANKKGSPIKIILPIVAIALVAAIIIGIVAGTDFGSGSESGSGNEPGGVSGDNVLTADNQPSNTRYLKQETILTYDYDVLEEKRVITYDQFGFKLSDIKYDANGALLESTEYITDGDGKFIEIKHVNNEDPSKNYDEKITYTAKDGKYVGTYKIGDEEYEITFVSVNNYKITKKATAVADSLIGEGEYTSTQHYYVDKNGYRVKEEDTGGTGFEMHTKSVIDGKNTIEAVVEMSGEGQTSKIVEKTTYNKNGFLAERIINTDSSETKSETKYVYELNENNLPASIRKYENGKEVPCTQLVENTDGKKVFDIAENEEKKEYILESDGLVINDYDQYDDQKRYEKYNANGELLESVSYRYDAIVKRYYEYAG